MLPGAAAVTAKLIGGGLILAGAVYVLWLWYRRRRRQREVLWSLVGALGYMETAIRWQRMPLPRIFQTLAQRPNCGPYFEMIAELMQSNIPLHVIWEKAFSDLPEDSGVILCRVELDGDGERLEGSLRSAREELTELCRRREKADRQQGRVTGAAVLSAACLFIILLL